MKGEVGTIGREEVFPNPITVHTADSRWQYCDCRSCQGKRALLDSLPGVKIDFNALRLKDEKY